jgi:protein TonB
LSADLLRGDPERKDGRAALPFRRIAVVAAILLHLAVPVSLLAPLLLWHTPIAALPPPAIPVTLVMVPPPAAPPPAAPRHVDPRPHPEAPRFRESGPELQTAGPPAPPTPPKEQPAEKQPPEQPAAREEPAPEPPVAPIPPAEMHAPDDQPRQAAASEPPPPPVPDAVPLPEAPKPALLKAEEARPSGPAKPTPPPRPPTKTASVRPPSRPALPNKLPAPEEHSGDPYFNKLRDEMEKHRFYPELARPLGLSGTVVFELRLDRAGNVVLFRILQSSGAELLDNAVRKMVADTAPFPPPPAEGITVTGHLTLAPP